jgi:hypothetical protein
MGTTCRSHAVFLPYPAQGHINPMLKLAKLLHHSKGFHITFINTEFNHNRLLRSCGPKSVTGLSDFRFETIPDGLPQSDKDATQDIPALCEATRRTCPAKLKEVILRIEKEEGVPPVTCVVADGAMGFAVYPAKELGLPVFLFFTHSACGLLAYLNFAQLVKRGYTPFRGTTSEYITNIVLDIYIYTHTHAFLISFSIFESTILRADFIRLSAQKSLLSYIPNIVLLFFNLILENIQGMQF